MCSYFNNYVIHVYSYAHFQSYNLLQPLCTPSQHPVLSGDQVAQLPVSVSAPADALANVQEETKVYRNDLFCCFDYFNHFSRIAQPKLAELVLL